MYKKFVFAGLSALVLWCLSMVLTTGWNFPKARPSGKRTPEVGWYRTLDPVFTTARRAPKKTQVLAHCASCPFAKQLLVARSATAGRTFGPTRGTKRGRPALKPEGEAGPTQLGRALVPEGPLGSRFLGCEAGSLGHPNSLFGFWLERAVLGRSTNLYHQRKRKKARFAWAIL